VAQAVTGRTIPVQMAPRREGDPARLVGDARKAISELGWTPQFHQLDRIIETAWYWHRKAPGR